jgi:hypothetical protein
MDLAKGDRPHRGGQSLLISCQPFRRTLEWLEEDEEREGAEECEPEDPLERGAL